MADLGTGTATGGTQTDLRNTMVSNAGMVFINLPIKPIPGLSNIILAPVGGVRG